MKTIDVVLQKFHKYGQTIENLHNKRMEILQSDNCDEFKSDKSDLYLVQHSICRQLTLPGSPQQN